MNYIVLDCETQAIQGRPQYPPEPVGWGIKLPNRPAKYYAFGHPEENNCSFEDARIALKQALGRELPIVCHNYKFDAAVLEEKMGVKPPDPCHIHDTMILSHLHDPYATTHALKPLAEKLLGIPPTERDDVREWLVEKGICKRGAKDSGAYISFAPGDLVGRYCMADCEMTAQLFDLLYADIEKRNMLEAYDRERFLIPVLMENERRGVRVDLPLLEEDFALYTGAMERVEGWLRESLHVPELNFNADQQLADALESNGIVTKFAMTEPTKAHPKGQRSVAKDALRQSMFTDQRVFLALGYRNRLQTCLSTFIGPWLETARKSGGRIYTGWRQLGAVTGRFSSSPNFQNIPKNWYDKPDGYALPDFIDLPELPLIRKYILPEEGHVLVGADYSGQEVRVLAHYEFGALLEAFKNPNPPKEWLNKDGKFDVHSFVSHTIQEVTGQHYERRVCKVALFRLLYGSGARGLATTLDIPVSEAQQIKDAIFRALPGVKGIDDELKQYARAGLPFYTLGGREYYCEPDSIIKGQRRSWDYKMLNTLIQGSSADQTKAAILRYDANRKHGHLLIQVHDELLLSVPEEHALDEAAILVEAMEHAMELDTPITAEVKIGPNFASMKGLA